MNVDRFWSIVDLTRQQAPHSLGEQAEVLRRELGRLPLEELLEFESAYTGASYALYTWEIWRAADIMIGDTSEDVFADFRSWMISRGRSAYEGVVASADHGLAALEFRDDDGEDVGAGEVFGAVAHDVYQARTGVDLVDAFPDRPSADFPDFEPAGADVGRNRKERRAHFPELAAKYPEKGKLRFFWRS
ncbi:hypothetical protein MLP_06160 [Microlunatus phosphovorus NM-1]|uniref:DUF4240 domain-containing protein n=1 Tax=Microlunatus phosphovorus (strain ATCC 700054 / DSM 10555 / JCM 9379 / NBRC 101784 / NCIMB 13414 / VKM Ac-1990 / NM-1) TaxID=1032480 RepID=F5XKU2_MICPN|nr:DUF4240 domain-containing protein [Microlunatus phosphovorus]BAK33630.1 hypothetical protein MLP_06160 [Microlunatus phosphovorus NM-1]